MGAPPIDGVRSREAASGDAAAELGMTDAAGEFWRPFARTVVCSPAGAGGEGAVRVTECRMPPALGATTDRIAPGPTAAGRVVVTAAGLWVGPCGSPPPYAAAVRAPSRDTLAIELVSPERALDEGLCQSLALVLERLGPGLRERVVFHTHGNLTAKDRAQLHELRERHRLGTGRGHDGHRN